MRENTDQNNSEYGHFLRSVSFCGLFQDDLKKLVAYWNDHKIRTSRSSESLDGRPSITYELPEKYDAKDHKSRVNMVNVNLEKGLYSVLLSQFYCSDEFSELAMVIMEDLNFRLPSGLNEAEKFDLMVIAETGGKL